MSEKEQKNSTISRILSAAKGSNPEKVAARLLKSGQIDSIRKQRIAREGLTPWSIIRYQRVINPNEFPLPILPYSHVTPSTFESHLRFLKKSYNVMALGDLVLKIYHDEEIPDKTVALTFDYGHADFFLNAFPLLLKYEVPATVCIASGYIETQTFLPVDRIAFGLSALKAFRQEIPKFKYFHQSFLEILEQRCDDGQITDLAILTFIDGFNRLGLAEQSAIIKSFAQALEGNVELPVYEDFLRWEDVKRLVEYGVTFAMMGHGAVNASRCEPEVFKGDIIYCLDRMVHFEVPREKYFCFTGGEYNESSLRVLEELKLRLALSIGDFPQLPNQESGVKVLGRVTMAEENSSSEALFACRLARCVVDELAF